MSPCAVLIGPQGDPGLPDPRDKPSPNDGVTIYLDTFNDKKRPSSSRSIPAHPDDGISPKAAAGAAWVERFDRTWITFFLADAAWTSSATPWKWRSPSRASASRTRAPKPGHQDPAVHPPEERRSLLAAPLPRQQRIPDPDGHFEKDGAIARGKNIEVMPVVTGSKRWPETDPQAGLNFKWD